MKKPVKQMYENDFIAIDSLICQPIENKEYLYWWYKKIIERINYLTPLIKDCERNKIDLCSLSKELHEEWVKLHHYKKLINYVSKK